MTTGAGLLLSSPATIAPPFLGLWPLLGAILGRDARSRRGPGPRRPRPPAPGGRGLLGYADAIRAGQQGQPGDAETRVRRRRPADGSAGGPGTGSTRAGWRRRRHWPAAGESRSGGCGRRSAISPAAATNGWRPPAALLLRQAGATVPRNRPGDGEGTGLAACPRRDRARGGRAPAGRAGSGQPRDRRADVPVAAHGGEARGEPARQDRPAPGPAGWVFRRH